MEGTLNKKKDIIENVKNHFANINAILLFLESKDYLNRRIGFALCIPKFEKLSEDLRVFVVNKWKTEPSKIKMGESFTQLCDRIFLTE